jgi:lactate permease
LTGVTWTQNYDPAGAGWQSTVAAALPVVVLLGLLASGRVAAPRAALAGLVSALVVAILVFRPYEAGSADGPGLAGWATAMTAAAGYGAAFGLLPVGWIVLSAIFLYNLTVETGQFEVVKRSIIALSDDRRLQALLIAFCFGAFVEGAAGFGTPVAISAALLVGAGFAPKRAAALALLANTSPVAFGALGIPITTLARVTGLDELRLSAMAGRQLPFFSLLIPAWLVCAMAGWRGLIDVWPALVVSGGSFAIVQFALANYHGPWLVDVVAGLVSLVCLAALLKMWRPRNVWRFAAEGDAPAAGSTDLPAGPADCSRGAIVSAWVPWLLLTVCVFVWGLPSVKGVLGRTAWRFEVPALHRTIARTPPVVPARTPEEAVYEFNWLGATGTGIFVAAVLSAVWLRVPPAAFLRVSGRTARSLAGPLATIACMLALAFTTRYSGMDATLGLAFTHTGAAYPFFAALLGWLGVALTGSDTSANALFGGLQVITGRRLADLGMVPLSADQASLLLATANSTGGVMGKMIDAQSIVVASAATRHPGEEGAVLRSVFLHSLALAALMGSLVLVQAYWWHEAIP